jgi:hypothetical protein
MTNVYNKEHKKAYLNFTVFAFDCERLDAEVADSNDFADDFTVLNGTEEPLPF